MVTDDRRYPSSDTGSACIGEVVTASGGRDTESPVAGRESSGVGGIRENARVVQQQTWPPPRQRPIRRDWGGVVCFSCGKSDHAATRCPTLDELFPFMMPGWRAEKTPGGFIMIPPRRRRTESGDCSTPGSRGRGNADCYSPTNDE